MKITHSPDGTTTVFPPSDGVCEKCSKQTGGLWGGRKAATWLCHRCVFEMKKAGA